MIDGHRKKGINMNRKFALTMIVCVLTAPALAAEPESKPAIEATTAAGEKVLLHPNGRWEFRDAQKQAEAKKLADEYPENKGCPPGWQGGLIPGYSRCIPPGDKDYNRGSLGRR
jgi:hypothetical protein